MGVLDKVRKFKSSRPKNDNRPKTRGIFHDWQDGPNEIRLVGEFVEVKTHFIAPAPKRKERGLCQESAFDKDNPKKIAKVINCPDWDIASEQVKEKKTCPVCKLFRLADQALKEGPDEEEKKFFEGLKSLARYRTNLKWNIFDREKPNVTVIDESGSETQQKGLKIATIGMEAWDDIEGIFEQCGIDITDPDKGVDIKVVKGHNGTRVAYSAQAILENDGEGNIGLRVTPFDKEEKEIVAQPHDLKSICGKQTNADDIRDGLHGNYADLLEVNEEDETPDTTYSSAEKEEETEEEEASADDDEDDVLGGTEKKK